MDKSWRWFRAILFPKARPRIPNIKRAVNDGLPDAGLVKGNLIIGEPGKGKTSYLALYLHEYRKRHPDQSGFIFDNSGDLTNKMFHLIAQEPPETRERTLRHTIYEAYGHELYVLPQPEFSDKYGTSLETQIERVKQNWIKLADTMPGQAPILAGVAIQTILPELFKVITAIKNELSESWQVTELARFIHNPSILKKVFTELGNTVPETTKSLLRSRLLDVKAGEAELRTYALIRLLEALEQPYVKARLGYWEPAHTPKEAIEKGQWVFKDGSLLNSHETALNYLITQDYSLLMHEINKRVPHDPANKPVSLVLDETYTLLSIPGMAEQIGKISPLYRSRRLQLFVVIQALAQIDRRLKEQIWSLGNIVSFALQNKDEAEIVARQLFMYDFREEKLPPKTEWQNQISEPQFGQDRQRADWITELPNRHFVTRRYLSEFDKDQFARWGVTSDLPISEPEISVAEIKDRLLKERCVLVRDALEVVASRVLPRSTPRTLT